MLSDKLPPYHEDEPASVTAERIVRDQMDGTPQREITLLQRELKFMAQRNQELLAANDKLKAENDLLVVQMIARDTAFTASYDLTMTENASLKAENAFLTLGTEAGRHLTALQAANSEALTSVLRLDREVGELAALAIIAANALRELAPDANEGLRRKLYRVAYRDDTLGPNGHA